jgi:flavin-binding protein dodecin
MSDNVYKKIEIVGTSETSLEDAIQSAVGKAAQTVRRMGWFEVEEIRGAIKEDQVAEWQVTVKIGFTLED